MSRLSRAATASTATKPAMIADHNRVFSVEVRARVWVMSASQPGPAARQAADDDRDVLDGGAQRGQWRGVLHRLAERVVDLGGLVADRPGQQQDRRDPGADHDDDHAADDEP